MQGREGRERHSRQRELQGWEHGGVRRPSVMVLGHLVTQHREIREGGGEGWSSDQRLGDQRLGFAPENHC